MSEGNNNSYQTSFFLGMDDLHRGHTKGSREELVVDPPFGSKDD
jgi:hypothetical protein